MSSQDRTFEALVDDLAEDVGSLDVELKPLLENFKEISSKLPVLDQAKLNVLLAYAIESIIFSALRLEGVDAKKHEVFKELARTRQYFEKIKTAETPVAPRPESAAIDKQAAIRFIRADLADEKNKILKANLDELLAKERAKAALKKRQADGPLTSGEPSDASKMSAEVKSKKHRHRSSKAKGEK